MELITTLRQYKIFDMAIFDWLATLICAYLFAIFVHNKNNIKIDKTKYIILTTIFFIILSIYIHVTFNIDTMFGYYLGLSNLPSHLPSN